MKMVDLATLRTANAERWEKAHLTRNFDPVAGLLISPTAKKRYQAVESRTGVPWFVIGVIHMRESGQSWTKSLAQGDPWDRTSVHVPVGRGPFKSWEDAAYDALVNCAPYAARNKDWGLGALLTLLEQYNGLGYAMRNLPSPYVWSGTDQYTEGKFTADGFFNPTAVDSQLGCAGLLMAMQKLDSDVARRLGTNIVVLTPPAPQPANIFTSIFNAIASIFKKGK